MGDTEVWWLLVRGSECIHATKDRALSDRFAITYQDVKQVRHVATATTEPRRV